MSGSQAVWTQIHQSPGQAQPSAVAESLRHSPTGGNGGKAEHDEGQVQMVEDDDSQQPLQILAVQRSKIDAMADFLEAELKSNGADLARSSGP